MFALWVKYFKETDKYILLQTFSLMGHSAKKAREKIGWGRGGGEAARDCPGHCQKWIYDFLYSDWLTQNQILPRPRKD